MIADKQPALIRALQALKVLQDSCTHVVIHGSEVLGEANMQALLQNGFIEQVIKGWYIASSPAHAGTTIAWYASYWSFVSAYCGSRFGEAWCLTPEESLMVLSGSTIIPQQVVVRVANGSNSIQTLPHQTSILNITAKLPSRIAKDPTHGLNVYPLAEALLRASPAFFATNSIESRACLNALQDDVMLRESVREAGGSYVGRLVGALKAIGRNELAESIRAVARADGKRIEESNPFERTFDRLELPACSPIAARLRLMWATMRERLLTVLPEDSSPVRLRPLEVILKDIDEGYVADSYHSLSIEGYRVSEELIRRVASGDWDPKTNSADMNQRNALAASGYYRAYREVRAVIERIVNGADAAMTIAENVESWHRELFMPCVDAGILDAADLATYRRTQVYIAGSRYTPPATTVLSDAMEAFYDLFRAERDYRIRALLGHFFFVHIHPYSDGNGRTARLVMNASLVAGGGRWKVIPVEMREKYMQSLEKASVSGEIDDFAALVFSLRK